ncbi:MAG: T9SS type A sorting domain-containing protein, partial [bacterium]
VVDLTTASQPTNTLDQLTVCDVETDIGFPMDSCQTYSYMAGITDIAFIQTPGTDTTLAPDASQIVGEQATISGVVTNADGDYDGGHTFFVRDDTGPWNGVYVYYTVGTGVVPGDEVVVSGIVDEYYNMTEISSVDYVEVISTGGTAEPDTLTPAVLTDSLQTESWEGCFVMMECVEAFTERDEFGEWLVGGYYDDPDSVAVGSFGEYIHPGAGNLVDITGNFRYHQGQFKIEPRDTVDLTPRTAGVTPGDADERPRAELRLYQNAPNPFAGGTVIRFSVPSQMRAQIAVYDVMGREVRVLTDSTLEPGNHQVEWDGRDLHGKQVSSGIYFYRFVTPNSVMRKKMVMLK